MGPTRTDAPPTGALYVVAVDVGAASVGGATTGGAIGATLAVVGVGATEVETAPGRGVVVSVA